MTLPPPIPISHVGVAPPGQLLQAVLEVLPAAVSVLRGPEHHVEYLNPLSQRLAGGREVLGRTARDAYPELQGQDFFEQLDRVYATGEAWHASDARVLFDRDGDGELEEAFFSLAYQPLLAPDGSVSGIVTLSVEVTDLVRAREQLEAARVEAEAQAEQISGMATQLEEQAAELEQQLAEAQVGAEEMEVANQELAEANLAAAAAREEEAELVETLHRIGTSLTAEFDLERIVQSATDEATRLTAAQFGAFFYNVLDEAGESYTLYTISGVPREAFSKFPMPRNTAVFSPTFHGEGVVRSDDITLDPRYGRNAPYHGMPPGPPAGEELPGRAGHVARGRGAGRPLLRPFRARRVHRDAASGSRWASPGGRRSPSTTRGCTRGRGGRARRPSAPPGWRGGSWRSPSC